MVIPASMKMHHADWIEQRINETEGKLVIADPDMMFWKSMEFVFDSMKSALVAGHHVPFMHNEWAGCNSIDRLHTELLFMPDSQHFLHTLKHDMPVDDYLPLSLFRPQTIFIQGKPLFYDTFANATHALSVGQKAVFQSQVFSCYDHINSASFIQQMSERMEYGTKMAEFHKSVFEDVNNLRGHWKNVEAYYARMAKKVS